MSDDSPAPAVPPSNWAATPLSLALVTGVALLATAALVAAAGTVAVAAAAGAGMALLVAAVRLFDAESGYLLAAPLATLALASGGAALLGSLALALTAALGGTLALGALAGPLVVAVGVAGSVAGVLAAWWGVVGEGAVETARAQSARAGLVVSLLAVAAGVAHAGPVSTALSTAGALLGTLLAPPAGRPHAATFLLLVAAASAAARVALRAVSPATLVPVGRREAVRETTEKTLTALRVVAWGSLAGAVLAGVAALGGARAALYGPLPPVAYDLLAVLTTAGPLRFLLLVVALAGTAVAATLGAARRLVATPRETLRSGATPASGGLLALLALAVHGAVAPRVGLGSLPVYPRLAALLGEATLALAGAVLVLLVANAVLLSLPLVRSLASLDRSTAGGAIAAGGLLVLVVGAVLAGVGALVAFAGAAAAMLVRDVGEYGATLGREAGRAAPHRRAELLHGVGSALVDAGGVALAATLGAVGAGLSFPTAAVGLPVLVTAVVGLLALVVALALE
ncbi:MAG: hypothetical protein ABEJ30_07310 [Halorientalis sp.]